ELTPAALVRLPGDILLTVIPVVRLFCLSVHVTPQQSRGWVTSDAPTTPMGSRRPLAGGRNTFFLTRKRTSGRKRAAKRPSRSFDAAKAASQKQAFIQVQAV